jgi:flavin reductase (DIM6/NTAB) family NADH-FMN oxidoreductase RutF
MFYEPQKRNHGLRHDPFKALVAPRPIGWVSTLSQDGARNLAPYSFFNAVSEHPPYLMFSSAGRKDSLRNAEATGEFVCSLATWELREGMNASSAGVPPDADEFTLSRLEAAPSRLVKPPRVAASPVAFECRTWKLIEIPGAGGYIMVIGEVVGIHIEERFISDGLVDTAAMRPLARLGYMDYSVVEEAFTMQRPQ